MVQSSYIARYPGWMVGNPLLYSSAALASLGGAMFGYGQGIIAAAQDVSLAQVKAGNTGVDVFVQAIVVSCLNLAALFASYAIGGVIYFISTVIQIFMPNLTALVVGRCIQGVGLEMFSMTVFTYQCEIAPGHGRGLFVSIEYLCLNSGYTLSAWVGYAFFFAKPFEISWPILALLLMIWTFFLPETPRWLLKNGFREEGLQAFANLHGTGDIDDPVIIEAFVIEAFVAIETAIKLETSMGDSSWGQLFTQYTRRSIVGITCQLFAQFNTILYFLPENLTRAGFNIGRSLLYSGACALIYCAGTIPTIRPFLLTGSFALAGALTLIGGVQFHAYSLPEGGARLSSANGIFAGVCLYLFIFGATWGPVPWLLGAEIFPLRARAKGMALSTSVNWISNFIIAFITPPLFSALKGGYYFLLLGFCVISGIFVFLVYPETSGKTLEELGNVFGDGREKGLAGTEAASTIFVSPSVIDGALVSSEATLQAPEEGKIVEREKGV
ncbi:general substrate transporter [Crassisporium funariophilum]|nr:general substrate transporter [Crassisporium funariophilum]